MAHQVLIDTNVLVYRFDSSELEKQEIATVVLREKLLDGTARLPHQAIVEFVAATTRGGEKNRLLEPLEAHREAEELMTQFPVLYPDQNVLRTAIRGASAYQLSWFDAHIWAYAEAYGVPELISEDFQHDRMYGSVMVRNPFSV